MKILRSFLFCAYASVALSLRGRVPSEEGVRTALGFLLCCRPLVSSRQLIYPQILKGNEVPLSLCTSAILDLSVTWKSRNTNTCLLQGDCELIKGYSGWRSILLFCRLQKHKIALQLHRSTSIYVDMACYLLICLYFLENQPVNCYTYCIPQSWDCRLKFWSPGVLLCGGHSTPCSSVLPVKIWHGFELLSMRSFPVDPNGFENRLQAWLAQGSLCWWSGQKMNSCDSRRPSWLAKGSRQTRSEGHWWSLQYLCIISSWQLKLSVRDMFLLLCWLYGWAQSTEALFGEQEFTPHFQQESPEDRRLRPTS